MSGEPPRFRLEIRKTYAELATPVPGELRREPIADADVPCPRCGAHEWLLVERRAEPHEAFTRWRALACAKCGAADGWESAGRARPERAAEQRAEDDDEGVVGLPDNPTLSDLCRLAPFRVRAPSALPKLRSYSHMAGRLTGVTVGSGAIEVTTEIRLQALYSLPIEVGLDPERRARDRLERMLDNWSTVLQEPRSEPAQRLHIAAANRQAAERAAGAAARQTTIDVDGAPVAFALIAHERCWAAVADVDDESITVAARDIPATAVALQTLGMPE